MCNLGERMLRRIGKNKYIISRLKAVEAESVSHAVPGIPTLSRH